MKLNKKTITLGILGSAILAYGVAPAISYQQSQNTTTIQERPGGIKYTFRKDDIECITETIPN